MAFPWIFHDNFELGTNAGWDSESDTDGIIETEDADGKQLGINGFINFLKSSIYLPGDEIMDTILNGINEFSPQPIKDDVFLILAGLK